MGKNNGDYLDIGNGVELYYESVGSGEPIIFIPGWTFTTELFQHQLEHFGQSHRAISYDPRSHGRSSQTIEGNNYATHGEDLIQLIEKLGLENVTLVGWSFGCLAQWEYVRRKSVAGVKKFVFVDLPPKCLSVNAEDWVEGPLDDIAGAYNAFLGSSKGQRDFITHYATQIMVQRELSADELFWINEQSLKTPHYIAASLFASGMFANYMAEAKVVDDDSSALYIVAEHWAETAQAFLGKHFPNSAVAKLGGHMMFWEHPDKFNRLVSDFLAK